MPLCDEVRKFVSRLLERDYQCQVEQQLERGRRTVTLKRVPPIIRLKPCGRAYLTVGFGGATRVRIGSRTRAVPPTVINGGLPAVSKRPNRLH